MEVFGGGDVSVGFCYEVDTTHYDVSLRSNMQ
jgi:hypothetical protein